MSRPRIVIPARFSASASALRYAAIVSARALAEAVYAAGGEPLTTLPGDPAEVAERFAFVDGVLLPGGGDLSPSAYGQPVSSQEVYDVDAGQDAVDLALARWAVASGMPLLAICRGMQVLNVALGGTLEQHMPVPHRHTLRPLDLASGSRLSGWLASERVEVSCFHHQRVARLADGLHAVATADDGTIEAVEFDARDRYAIAVQWHPEDSAHTDAANAALFTSFVVAAADQASAKAT